MKCEACKFFCAVPTGSNLGARGQCRVQPPIVMMAPIKTLGGDRIAPITVWPGVEGSEWCGRFEEGEQWNR